MTPNSATPSPNRLTALLLPSIGNLVFVAILFVSIFNLGNALLNDGDTGYHIRTGELIARTWRVPHVDPFSWHNPPLKWTAHEWLSELIMAILARFFGLTGVIVFFSFILAVTHWLLYRSLREVSDDVLLCVFTILLACATSSTHWLARPHAFSLLFTVVWCDHLRRFQPGHRATLILLPVIMLFWVNLHGGYFIGLALIAIYFTGNLVYALTAPRALSAKFYRTAKSLFVLLCLCIAVCMINPQGPGILQFPLRVASDRFVMNGVTEFLSPNFHDPLPFKFMLLTLIGALALSRSPLGIIESALTVLLSYMALYSVRHVALFAIILAPVLLKIALGTLHRLPPTLFSFYRNRSQNIAVIDAKVGGYIWPFASAALVVVLTGSGALSYRFDEKIFPVAAVEFLKREPIAGRMFNNDEFGDYIIFAAWPTYRVYIDGRSDMYGEKYGGDYLKVARALPGWKEILKEYDISWIIFDTESPLTAALQSDHEWRPIYSDSIATIFVKNDPAHTSLLAKYPAVKIRNRTAFSDETIPIGHDIYVADPVLAGSSGEP